MKIKLLNMKRGMMRVASAILVLLMLGVGNAWASSPGAGTHYASATTNDPAQGLVYMSKNNETSVADSKFKNYQPGGCLVGSDKNNTSEVNACYTSNGDNGCTPTNRFFWARPSRGWEFNGSWGTRGTDYAKTHASTGINNYCTKGELNEGPWTGTADVIQTTAGGQAPTWMRPIANFKQATKYTITYTKPIGGVYTVHYSYLESYDTGETEAGGNAVWKFRTATEDYPTNQSWDGDEAVTSYAADNVTLTAPNEATNFIGWYEGSTQKSTSKSYTYPITKTATITALFKVATLGTATGDLSPVVNAGKASELPALNGTVTVPVSAYSTWATGDFEVVFTEKTSRGDVTKGTATYAKSTGDDLGSTGTLTIPFTFSPTSFGGTEVEVTITPKNNTCVFSNENNTKKFTILASANKVLNYEACVLLGEETEPQDENTGTLAEMVALANTMDSKPKVQLAKNCTIAAPLSLTKSMTFDLNDKTLTSTGASAFSIAAQGIDVKIIDNGFSKLGTIAVSSSQSGNVNIVSFAQKAKLTMQGGTLSATNTGSGSAYGINVTQGSTFYMTDGQLTVTATSGSAEGAHISTTNDYATFNGGSITVSSPANAYGLWSAGQSNITNATIDVKTTTGANAYGVYVNGGVSTLTTNTVTTEAKTTGAYAAYVNAGRLNGNGGSFAATVVTSGAYGVHVASGATAMLQQNANVTADATGVNGTSVFGVNNLGTVSLTNVSVTATSPTTAATAVNTATSAISTTIEGGTYRANTTGGTAYGLHHQYGALNVDGGEFKAVGGSNSIYGARATVDATIANATMHGETIGSGNTAYGFVGATAGANITLTNCTIKGLSATNKAYAIFSRANVTATGCTLTATTAGTSEAYGMYAENGTNQLINSDANVSANTVKSFGVYHKAGTLTINGGQYDVEVKQETATGPEDSELYGIYQYASGLTTTVSDASFNVMANNVGRSQNVYGAYIQGVLESTGCTYSAQAKLNVYGVWGNTASTLTLANNTISSRATNGTVSYGVYAKKNFTIDGDVISAVGSTTNVYAMFFDASTSDGDVLGGKFSAQTNANNGYGALNDKGTVGKVKLRGGVYKTTINLQKYVHTGYQVFHLDETHADYADGYRYTIATQNPSPYVCRIVNGAYYATLEEALQYTQDHEGTFTIVMTQSYTLPAGDYVLPANATLIVPRKFEQTTITENGNPAIADKITTVDLNENFLCLTLASDAHINVDGKIGVSGEMYCTQSGGVSNQSPYGRIHMESGSHIQLNSGAYLYAWGMITGAGSITVKSNAEVREMFQVKNMPSASNLRYYIKQTNSSNTTGFMPFNQYSIQNIEVPTTYYFNSRLMTEMRCYYLGADFWYGDGNIKLVGTSDALFEVTSDDESSWVCKSYDATNKQQVWKVNSSAQLGSISITMKLPIVNQTVTVNSADYILPITNTMKIHVLDGDFAITNDTELMPGSSVEINKTASLSVNSGKKLYVFDQHQWTSTSYPDAAINVHGNINVAGALYTTNSIASGTNATNGANIYSNNADAGTIFFENAAPSVTTEINLITGIENNAIKTRTVTMDPAQLKNGDGNYTSTSGTAADHSFAYMNNVWTPTYTNECFEVVGENVYVKPSGYVQLKNTTTNEYGLIGAEETNHTYLTVDDKLLIQMDDCQWWEVEATSDPTVFECKKSGYEGFYYYDDSDPETLRHTWKLKTVNVKFYSAEEGETVLKTIVTDYNGIPDQAIIATNPTKTTTADYTYQFYGWKSSVTGTEYKWTDQLEVATADMSYRPVFTETKRNYTITLKDANNGADVPLEVPYGETPEYTPKKDATAQYTYTFDHWAPTFSAVTGPATYTAHWNSVVNNYDIIWKNGDDVLEVDENQPYGTATSYNGATPTKEMDDQYEYTFSKWKSSLDGNLYNDGSTPSVAGETTYEAQYTTTPRYAVTFNNYDGTQLARIIYTQGETPAYVGVPTRKRDADGYFKFIGWKNSNGDDYAANVTLPAVTKKETYTAQYEYVTELYTITLRNVKGRGAEGEDNIWSGKFGVGSTPFYDPNEDDVPDTPTKEGDAQYSYPFTGWTPSLEPVSGPATYTAQFGQQTNSYTITFANIDGHDAEEIVEVEYGSTPVCDNLITAYNVDQQMYLFRAWKRSSDQHEYTPLPEVVGDETYTAQYDPVENLNVDDDKTINSDASVGITIVRQTGKLTLTSGKTLTTSDLILEASESASGQIMETGTITATNVYYDLKLNTDARHWHAFGVPWAVDINANELQEVDNGGNVVRTLRISHDYEIVYFDGEERAANGSSPDCWKYLRHYEDTEHGQPVDELIPGHGYMIAFASHVNTVRFTKKNSAPIIFNGSVGVKEGQICGLSNPMAYHAILSNMGATFGQVHDGGEIGHDDYEIVDDLDTKRFVVGKTVYIEPTSTISAVTITKADGSESPVSAPARRGMATDKQYLSLSDYYTVALTPEDGSRAAKVYVLPEEDKEDKYVAGHDLAKMGMSDRKAQIWVERYEAQLGLNTTAPIKEVATFPINLYAPKAGEYIISLASQPNDEYTVYLMRDGAIIWNLSRSGYAITLDAGTDKTYSLRLTHKSPGVMIDIEEELVDAQGETSKVIINGKVFIIRGNQVYSIDGQIVKFGNNND